MSAVEEIEAARDKLRKLREASTQGEWTDGLGAVLTTNNAWVCGDTGQLADSELIAVMHATIDAQLELLRRGASFLASVGIETSSIASPFVKAVLALARAINATS